MARTMTEKYMTKIIEAEIKHCIEAALPAIIKGAQEQVEREIKGQIAHVAMSVMQNYEVVSCKDVVTIRVQNKT